MSGEKRVKFVFKLTEESRAEVLRRFPPAFSYANADRITGQSRMPANTPTPLTPQNVRVVGYANDEALEMFSRRSGWQHAAPGWRHLSYHAQLRAGVARSQRFQYRAATWLDAA